MLRFKLSRMEKNKLYKVVGGRIAERRKTVGLTQVEVAQLTGVSRPSLANMERGDQVIALHHLYKLISALELERLTDLIPNSPKAFSVGENRTVYDEDFEIISTSELSDAKKDAVSRAREQILAR